MCGLAGLYSFSDGFGRDALMAAGRSMQAGIAHRGPDSGGLWADPDAPLVFAHCRLAIVDLSADGAQPMTSPCGRYVITYNGEIYNFRDLKAALESDGAIFKTRCDTEVLLQAIIVWGLESALERLNGMYAFALWDRQDRTLHFARDRFGKKPLYIGWAGTALAFASELKSFHALSSFVPEIDRNALALYMRFGHLCAPHAIFKNVWQLPPGGCLSFAPSALRLRENLLPRMRTYWPLRDVVERARANPAPDDEREILETFSGKLSLAVARRMDCDVPFGSFLSGGIDSSLVTAMMQAHSPHPVKTFSIGFSEGGFDESRAAADVAAHLRTDHHSFTVEARDALAVIPALPDMYDEPFADPSQIPTHLVAKLARDHVTVALTGDGGDEILGGYQRHTHIPGLWQKMRWLPGTTRSLAAKTLRLPPQSFYDAVFSFYPQAGRRAHRLAQVMAAKDANALYASLIEAWPERDNVVPGSTMPSILLDDPSAWPDGLSLSERMIYADTLSYRPNDLMVKTDRATMAVALEARAPLMDHELCEYSWSLPHHMKIRGLEGKWLLRRLLERHVPRAVFERPKTGFGVPLDTWLRGPLRDWASALLDETRLRDQGLLNAPLVAGRWRDFIAGRGVNANASDLWTALMFQSWHDRWMKK